MNSFYLKLIMGVSVPLTIIVLFFITLYFSRYYTYVENYHAYLGVGQLARYDALMDVFGEPLMITPLDPNTHSVVTFNGVTFVVAHGEKPVAYGMIAGTRISDSEIRFGRRRIGVGSTRAEVRSAYRWLRLLGRGWAESDHRIEVVDGSTWVTFDLDENGKVIMVRLTIEGP